MIEAVIDGRIYYFDPDDEKSIVGSGGEADVFWLENPTEGLRRKAGNVRLLFKSFRDDSEAHLRAALERQEKLPVFPFNLSDNVAKPLAFGHDRHGRIIGYVLAFVPDATPLFSFKTNAYREANRVTIWQLLQVLRSVLELIKSVHKCDVVIGDLNDNNFLIKIRELTAFLLDADSLSYGKWSSRTFMDGFICPLICRPPDTTDRTTFKKTVMQLKKVGSHTEATDWYAFCVIVFQLLACIHPYLSGVHNPEPGKREFQGVSRIHMRISAFDPRVTLPKLDTAIPFGHWPPALLQFMKQVFTEDLRCNFPIELLDPELWIQCPSCDTPHGHSLCPVCGAKGVTPKQVTFSTTSKKSGGKRFALTAASQGDELRGVFHFDGAYRREDGSVVWQHAYLPEISAHVAGDRTVLCVGTHLKVVTRDSQEVVQHETDVRYGQTTVAANSRHIYWIRGNALVRDGRRGITRIESVPSPMTSVWAGESFGVAVVQAGLMTRVTTFDAERLGWQGTHNLGLELGTVTDMHCIVGDDYAWLTITSQATNGAVTNRCYVFDRHANLRATAEARGDDGTWLGTIARAACAVSDKLIIAMAGVGIVQIGIKAQAANAELVIPDTAQHVSGQNSPVSLCHTSNGLFLTTTTKITKIS